MLRHVYLTLGIALCIFVCLSSCKVVENKCGEEISPVTDSFIEKKEIAEMGNGLSYNMAPSAMLLNEIRSKASDAFSIADTMRKTHFSLDSRIQGKRIEKWISEKSSELLEEVRNLLLFHDCSEVNVPTEILY